MPARVADPTAQGRGRGAMTGPRVTVGMPVRNGERHLRAGLDALWARRSATSS